MTFDQKRVLMGVLLVLLLVAGANEWYEWNLLGWEPKRVRVVLTGVMGIVFALVMPGMLVEMREREAREKAADLEYARTRDKAEAAKEAEKIRRDIGMPPP